MIVRVLMRSDEQQSGETANMRFLQQPMSPKRFCTILVLLALGAWIGVAGLNFIVNPYAQYRTRFFVPLVQTSRAQKLQLLKEMTSPPEGLILGSSRVLKIEPDYLESRTGLRFFNAGVNHARPEDQLAILRYFHEQFGCLPKMIVLGLDVSAFSDASVDARLLSQPDLVRQIPEAIRFRDRNRRWQELLSWQQTRVSMKSLQHAVTGRQQTQGAESFRPDGLLIYHERESQIAAGTYDFASALTYNKREYKQLLADFDKLSARRLELFKSLVVLCRDNGVKLVVFTTPLHPELAEYLDQNTDYSHRRRELTRFLVGASERNGFDFFDLSEIDSFVGHADRFVDGIHPLESNTRRMIERMLNPSPRPTYAIQ